MIKINLLPERKIKKPVKKFELNLSGDIVKKLLIPAGVTLFILVLAFIYCELTKSGLQKDIAKQKEALQSLQKKIAEVKKFEAMNKDIEAKTKLIENLKRMQSAPVNILSIVVKKIPDGVWLTGLNYDETITVEGIGFSNLNVVAFVENLKETPELQDVYLVESQQTEFEKQAVYRFIVKFRLKV
ncbi:PilN domain-containing protein [Thermodesulfovibrio thiophilus]|uniref:PilN domain-containing protein n=1 Tax=Thermodesulfovibrio thiophilus TaxID=340095 RepID=UPI000422F0C8|nr:PilN domain-containing protein [Thermodesulfovibrio thiophilus]